MSGLMRNARTVTALAGLVAWVNATSTAKAQEIDTYTWEFPRLGMSVQYFLGADSPLIGKEVVSARFYVDFEADPGSDAANLVTDFTFPIVPFDGGTNFFYFSGADHGWSGAGAFSYFLETDEFNGTFISTRYGAETYGELDGAWLENARIEVDYIVPEPAALSLLLGGMGVVVARRRG